MPWVDCAHCRSEFYREFDERWKRLCLASWLRKKNGDLVTIEAGELEELRTQLACYRGQCLRQITGGNGKPGKIEEALQQRIKRLLLRAHPDKHQNRELSNEITKWLIELKDQYGSRNA